MRTHCRALEEAHNRVDAAASVQDMVDARLELMRVLVELNRRSRQRLEFDTMLSTESSIMANAYRLVNLMDARDREGEFCGWDWRRR